MTSISLYGAYEHNDPDYPQPGWGHPKDRRPDLKQIQAGIAVSADGAIPVFHQAYDGGAGEVSQVIDAMHALQKLAAIPGFLMVGDSKLLSRATITAMTEAEVSFLAPLAAARVPAGLFAGIDPADTTEVDYIAARDAGKPAAKRCAYRVTEDVMHITGPRKADPVHQVRRILVHSSANQTAAGTARALKLGKARTELDTLTRTAGTRHHPDTAAVAAKAAQISRHRRVGGYLRTTITTDPDAGKPVFSWHFDQTAIDAEAAGDGWYALLTNLHPADADAAEILRRYKGQNTVEQRYSTIKGPLAVTPIFLQTNKRITALITVICLALLIFSLIEREVRQRLAEQCHTDMAGFYAFDNRAVMMADGGNTIRGIDVLRHQRDLYGAVASAPTLSRALTEIDDAGLHRLDAARAKVRARVWNLIEARHGRIPAALVPTGDLGETIVLRIPPRRHSALPACPHPEPHHPNQHQSALINAFKILKRRGIKRQSNTMCEVQG